MKRSRWIAAALIAAASMSAAAWAEDVWVKSAVVTVRAGKGPVYGAVAEVKKGEKLAVIVREGPWIKVNVAGKEGYIHEKSLSTSEIKGEWKPFAGSANTASINTAAADRGLRENAVKYARGKNLSDAWMKWLEDFRDGLRQNPQEWETFMQQGRVGAAAPVR